MKQGKITLIYILGAGRSGSTILSTIMGSSNAVFNCADLMQFYEYGCLKKTCNDGKTLFDSTFWSEVINIYDPDSRIDYCDLSKCNHQIEHHRSFFRNYLNFASKKRVHRFLEEQEKLIRSISAVSKKKYIIDSSKYPNRALLLSRMKNIDVKFIYNIRDARGVINSFSKNVQTPRTPMSALFYYITANTMSELTYLRLPKANKVRIRYEDLMLNTHESLDKISDILNVNLDDVRILLDSAGEVDVGPVIEGNRMVKKRVIQLRYDNEWLGRVSPLKRILYYILSSPLMMLNRYKI